MALDITATHREYSTRARLDAQTQYLRDLPGRRLGFDAERSSADVPLLNIPTYEGGEDGTIDYGWNGESVRFFTGLIHTPSAASPSIDRTVRLMDKLGLLIQKSFTEDIVWSSQTFPDAVRDVLEGVGVAASDIVVIYDPGITLGGTYSITIGKNESPAEVFRQLMEYGGTKAIVYPNGKIYVLDVSGIPTSNYAQLPDGTRMIYAFGATSTELSMIEASWVLETVENPIVNVTITGPTRSDGVTPSGNAVLVDQSGRPWSQQYRFVQDAATADTIADRELSRRAVPRRVISFRADSNPYLMPGITIGFRDGTVGISTTTPVFVWAVAIDGPVMTVTVLSGLHIIDGPTTFPQPIAVPTIITIEKQPILVGGVSVIRYFVQMDGSASLAPGSYIVNYTWTATGATPSSSTDIKPLFIYTTLDGTQEITLLVEDANGQTNSVTITLPASTDSSVVRRQLLIAEGTNGLAFLDDGETFVSYTRVGRSCTAVPSINDQGNLLSGWDDGAVYKINTAHTGIEALATLSGGQINALWVNEEDGNNILAGAGSKLYQSTNGTTFVLKKDMGATINDCQNSPANANEIRVAAGQYLKLSFDGGTTFSDAITGATGTTARMIATAPWGHACVFIGGAAAADAIKFEEGYSVNWTAVASPPTALRTVTALLDAQGFVVGDGGGKLYKLLWDGAEFDATSITTIAATPSVDDGIRDGTLGSLQFYATTDGTKKLVNLATIYDVRANASVQIGYGAIGAYVAPGIVDFLVPTEGVAGGGVWLYSSTTGTWALKNSGLPAGVFYSRWISANPFNADHWLLLLNTSASDGYNRVGDELFCADNTTRPLWLTTTNGASFSAVTLTLLNSSVDFTTIRSRAALGWSTTTSGQWFFAGDKRQVGGTQTSVVWRGTGTASTSTNLTKPVNGVMTFVETGCDGLNNDVIVANGENGSLYTGWLPSGATVITPSGNISPITFPQMERAAGLLPAVYGADIVNGGNTIYYHPDYRSTSAAASAYQVILTNGNASLITSTADGSVFAGGTSASSGSRQRTSVLKLTNFQFANTGSSATEEIMSGTVVSGGEAIGMVRSDRQTRTALAARLMTTSGVPARKDAFVSDDQGATWTRVIGPPLAGNSDLANRIEVLKRGG